MSKTGQVKPMVSVWMVTYNHAKFIRKALESIVMQKTDFALEVIIGDDCSTDGTQDVIREFERDYPDIFKPVYHQKNVGAYRNAYEFCYPLLTGKYIACLEGDDYWDDENKLQMQVDALEADLNATICFTQVAEFDESRQKYNMHWSFSFRPRRIYTILDILVTFNIVTCTLMFRNIYPVLPYNPNDFPTGDVSLCAFLLLKGYAIRLKEITAVYRVHSGGTFSSQTLEKKNMVFLKIFERLLTYPQFKLYSRALKKLASDRAYQALCFEIKKSDPDKVNIEKAYEFALKNAHSENIFYPLKTILRKNLYYLTGQSFGRRL
ncbi:glycosyltransferase [Hufsiella ginkgonis]|uniref:Glycosyltransferase n=1 Tax=Hufsiella ginkgonis TaxID=2695274 RepID=A0A7K1Y0S5_9SPHI|nr:glycosyltransferase [Hufsiella ginkgonis]MXV16697.1 glycosyltransferase [Hufsiella ginkgonis]